MRGISGLDSLDEGLHEGSRRKKAREHQMKIVRKEGRTVSKKLRTGPRREKINSGGCFLMVNKGTGRERRKTGDHSINYRSLKGGFQAMSSARSAISRRESGPYRYRIISRTSPRRKKREPNKGEKLQQRVEDVTPRRGKKVG